MALLVLQSLVHLHYSGIITFGIVICSLTVKEEGSLICIRSSRAQGEGRDGSS